MFPYSFIINSNITSLMYYLFITCSPISMENKNICFTKCIHKDALEQMKNVKDESFWTRTGFYFKKIFFRLKLQNFIYLYYLSLSYRLKKVNYGVDRSTKAISRFLLFFVLQIVLYPYCRWSFWIEFFNYIF